MLRYIALVFDPANAVASEQAQDIEARMRRGPGGWQPVFRCDHLVAFIAGATSSDASLAVRIGRSGLVIGALYYARTDIEEDVPARCVPNDPSVIDALLRGGGHRLIQECWGDYVAYHTNGPHRHAWILKDPTGAHPCHYIQHHGVQVFFSCLADVIALQLRALSMRLSYLRRRLFMDGRAFSTSLHGVNRVFGGECIDIRFAETSVAVQRKQLWQPARFTQPGARIDDSRHALRALRASLRSCAATLALQHDHLLHRLSGGIDSSVVLASLQHEQLSGRTTCYTYFNHERRSDERHWARLVANHLACAHAEYAFTPSTLPLPRITDLQPTVEPCSTLIYLQRAPLERQICAEVGASVVFTGIGGDSGLCRDSVEWAAADFLHFHGPRLRVVPLSAEVARHTDLSVWEVLRSSWRLWRGGWRQEEPFPVSERLLQLVDSDVKAEVRPGSEPPHPWFESEGPVMPTLARRLSALLQAREFYDLSIAPSEWSPAVISPMLSQPFVELCLRIPSYIHCAGGRDRSLARSAFAQDLPAAVVNRRWKDRAPGFFETVLKVHRDFIREFLLEGVLARERLLSRLAIEQALSPSAHPGQVSLVEIFNHLDLEAWARHWTARPESA